MVNVGIVQPAVVGGMGIGPHEGILYDVLAAVDGLVNLALTVVPEPCTASRDDRLDAQQIRQIPGFKDASLGVDERPTPISDPHPRCELLEGDHPAALVQALHRLENHCSDSTVSGAARGRVAHLSGRPVRTVAD